MCARAHIYLCGVRLHNLVISSVSLRRAPSAEFLVFLLRPYCIISLRGRIMFFLRVA